MERISILETNILQGIKDLFVPSEDYLSDKFAVVTEKFNFVQEFMDSADTLKNSLTTLATGAPPSVRINLSASRSKNYDYGETAHILNMDWFAEFKPMTDTLISAVIWITFLWNVFSHLPSIISGLSVVPNSITQVEKYGTRKENERKKKGGKT